MLFSSCIGISALITAEVVFSTGCKPAVACQHYLDNTPFWQRAGVAWQATRAARAMLDITISAEGSHGYTSGHLKSVTVITHRMLLSVGLAARVTPVHGQSGDKMGHPPCWRDCRQDLITAFMLTSSGGRSRVVHGAARMTRSL
jgi:hypothetical protein